ncbi:MAG: response regulator transcription factor [Clostridia bacterium]|nr:response regulator transcription factor [Clostridia bacterium]
MMFNIIFCDDNSQYLESLTSYVQKECSAIVPEGLDFSIGPVFRSGQEVLQYMGEHHVDVLLLDIDMPGMSGFDVAKIICKEYPHVKIVFMSAYDNFVYSSFEYYPFAYLRKSHLADEFPKIFSRLVERLIKTDRQIRIATTEGIKSLDANSILYIESERNYCTVHLTYGTKYVCRSTLTAFEQEITGFDFYRIHSAFIVNLEHVERIMEDGTVLVKNEMVPIAQKRAKEFKKAYMDYVRRCFNA